MGNEADQRNDHIRRKKLLFRAEHRGIKEMDVLLGAFARARLATLSRAEMDIFEVLLTLPDRELYDWIIGTAPIPEAHQSALLDAIRAYHADLDR